MGRLAPNLANVTSILADTYAPIEAKSTWYCDDIFCNGQPHKGWDYNHCRANQRPPEGDDWFIWLLLSGRGFGKSRCAAEWLLREASKAPNTEWGVIGPTSEAVRKCGEDLTAGLLAIAPEGLIKKYNRTLGDFYLSNGAIIHLISADKVDRLRGFNLAGAWCDELASWRYPDTWGLGLLPTLRDKRTTPHIVVTTTPKPTDLLRKLIEEERGERGRTVVTRGATFDNAENLAPEFLDEMRARYEGTRIGRQEIYGELLTDVDGALVTQEMIDRTRLEERPDIHFTRIVVAVDPATTAGEDADETGIIVCARGTDGRGYILADRSCKESLDGWAKVVARAYEEFHADRVVAEENQGKSMVETIVRSANPNISYKGVWAKKGKEIRAEPIAALYEQGKISHIGHFIKLEDQWTTWVPNSRGQRSPDRVDAAVHGLTELGLVGLTGVHIAEWMDAEHPPCHRCGMPAPKDVPVCPKCGAERPVVSQAADAEPATDQGPWSLTSGMGSGQRGNPQTMATLRMLQQMQGNRFGLNQWDR